jgi:L-ascorbate metabolism protein UlaG (beta-lactamase superfamily)
MRTILLLAGLFWGVAAALAFEKDIIKTAQGDLEILLLGHGTLAFTFQGKTVHIDPVGEFADYSKLPKADLILVTHEHYDHLNGDAIRTIKKENTILLYTAACSGKVPGGIVLKNGDIKKVLGLEIQAVPAYNIVHKRPDGSPYHPKGSGNGYVITFADKKVYVAGDTENIPEMSNLKNIDIAFLPMNLPYTMTPEMVAEAARRFKPHILYPYHYGDTDVNGLVKLMKADKTIEIRIRNLK